MDFDRLVVTNVSRRYGRRSALRRVSLTVEAGQLVGLLGPNGAGKSTLLGVLATLANPSAGTIRYGQVTAASADIELRRRIGLLSHELQIYAELTARENLEFFANLYDLDDPRGRSQRALERANLETRADDVVEGFSRGMRQRLALERTLLHEPRLVLLDEPFTGLDESSSVALRDRLRGLRAEGRLVLVATHDLDVADGLLDRAVLLRDGRLAEFDLEGGSLRERYRATLASDT